MLRLYAGGVLSEDQWRGMWAEWQDRRQLLNGNLHLLEQSCEDYIRDLDDALTLIAKLDILYEELIGEEKRDLLVNLLERVVVDTMGKIVRVEWLSPFAYLQEVAIQLETKTGEEDSACSRVVLQCGRDKSLIEPHILAPETVQFIHAVSYPRKSVIQTLVSRVT